MPHHDRHRTGWEIVAQKTRNPIVHMDFILSQMLLTGETRKVTADSRAQAAAKIERGLFDPA